MRGIQARKWEGCSRTLLLLTVLHQLPKSFISSSDYVLQYSNDCLTLLDCQATKNFLKKAWTQKAKCIYFCVALAAPPEICLK